MVHEYFLDHKSMQLQVVQEMHTAVKDTELLLHNQKYQTILS